MFRLHQSWYILSDTNDVIDVTQDTTTVPTNGQFAIALDVETVNKKFGIATIIENKDVIGLVGNTVTFSFKAKVSSTTKLDNVKAEWESIINVVQVKTPVESMNIMMNGWLVYQTVVSRLWGRTSFST